ncbi:hypothetical protein F5X96DRAFT_619145 [Biscogniauxia mediterranea]|nr:hypothetical protein F5X96DRAFT_619145 [Biscogniauxia mediterranea]
MSWLTVIPLWLLALVGWSGGSRYLLIPGLCIQRTMRMVLAMPSPIFPQLPITNAVAVIFRIQLQLLNNPRLPFIYIRES